MLTVLDPKEEKLLATSGIALSIHELKVVLGGEEGDPRTVPFPRAAGAGAPGVQLACDTGVASWDRVPLLLPESPKCGSRAES